MKSLIFLLIALNCPAAVPGDVASVVSLARQAPAEFGSDALIRLASLEKLDKASRIELLQEAFRRAGDAQQPLKQRPSILLPGGSGAMEQRAYDQGLDALSLRLRAVEHLLPLDAGKARALFLQIPPLKIPNVGCDDYRISDVSLFYEVLGTLARQSFTEKEVAEGAPGRLLAPFAAAVNAASEVEPAARMLAASSIKDQEFEGLIQSLGAALNHISKDDRSFTASVPGAGEQILALVEEARKRHVAFFGLVNGYRTYLVNNLGGARCADDDLMRNGEAFVLASDSGGQLGGAAGFFNARLAAPPIRPLREDEVTPSGISGAAGGLRPCQDQACEQMASQCRALIFDANGAPLSAQQKNSPDWQAKLQQFLSTLSGHKQSKPDAEQFREECALVNSLIGTIPAGPDRQRLLLAWLDYLEASPLRQSDHIAWFLPVNGMIGRLTLDSSDLGRLTEAFRQTHDPVISLYLELERVAPRRPDQILPLL
jgi:hypothetical protein